MKKGLNECLENFPEDILSVSQGTLVCATDINAIFLETQEGEI